MDEEHVPDYHWLVPSATYDKVEKWHGAIRANRVHLGKRLRVVLHHVDAAGLTPEGLIGALLRTKLPQIFAESSVRGDGSDWTAEELSILGDISCVVPVTVYDDGHHTHPEVHDPPFPAHLLFVPGALLRNGFGRTTPDMQEVAPNRRLDPEAYYRLYERRLVPVFSEVHRLAGNMGVRAVVTVPGLGCGRFAGPFEGKLGALFGEVLHRLLVEHAEKWPSIRLVHYDPYREGESRSWRINRNLTYRIRPLTKRRGLPQLSRVAAFDEGGDELAGCRLFSLVAWDHVSWPGNDFYSGGRATDDGVKAAATDTLYRMTGVRGRYHPLQHAYLPPEGFSTWRSVVESRGITLHTVGNIVVHSVTS